MSLRLRKHDVVTYRPKATKQSIGGQAYRQTYPRQPSLCPIRCALPALFTTRTPDTLSSFSSNVTSIALTTALDCAEPIGKPSRPWTRICCG